MTESHPAFSAGNSLSKSSFVEDERVRLLYMQAPVSNTVIFLVSFLYYSLLQPRLDSPLLLVWLLALFVTASYRIGLWYLRKKRPELRSSSGWLVSYCVGCGLVGVAWSLVYFLLNDENDPFVFAALVFLAFGVISVAVPVLAASLPAVILYILPQGAVLAGNLFCYQDSSYQWLALAVTIYLIMTILFARNLNKNILRSIRLQEENALLIDELNDEIDEREGLIVRGTLELQERNQELMKEIESRESTEEQLRRANADLDATLLAIPDLMFELDRRGKYIEIWAQDATLLAAQEEILLGHTVSEILPADASRVVMEAIEKAAEQGISHGQIIRLPLAEGEHWFELSTSKKQVSETSFHFLMLARDITEKQQMEEELFRAKKLESVGVLAGGIAHDFNNILSVILGNIELATAHLKKNDTAFSLLADAQKAAKRATKLTQQLLTFSKGGEPVKECTALAQLIQESADFVLHGSKVSCEYFFPDDLWMVQVDSGQVSQVIQNLVINAIHAMPLGGTMNISCENIEAGSSELLVSRHSDDFFVRITLQDSGSGIPQEIINNIFDPYFSTKEEGNGLGLAISHTIILKHHGSITVHSSPGQGTTFNIYLPADPGAVCSTNKNEKSMPLPRASRIMVMDDDKMIRVLVEAQLASLGHEAILAVDGNEAIRLYQEMEAKGTPVDLVIMDLTIPGGMGGKEAARKLLQLAPEAKIIVSSGYSNDQVLSHYRDYGFCAAVSKPFDMKELREGINSALSPE
ncbi:PAS domain S-box [Desulfocapsa sulfexigens DSM 10523]|uniref:histidine kinase n=1 Tax=Desulfocapsa sulfexigens (strain DSM 10523 / SB164P1) TaxID=1167006 RepID=M1PC27_DESSD|nr:ATP-binding protein [Desulfocapsa sulfexigens]AGF77310.1 PAS domain S-box [Desulfocapsa sulfexigens DSM 10523]